MPNSPLHMQRDNARSLIRRMVRSSTETEFDEAWGDAQRAWSAQGPKWKGFLDYFVIQWHYQADEWAGYSRKVRTHLYPDADDCGVALLTPSVTWWRWYSVQYEHSGVDTNNYLESWHQKLKRNYMKKRNLKMPDVIAMLLHEVCLLVRGYVSLDRQRMMSQILPLFRFAHLRVALKFAKASLTKAERRNRHTAMQYSETDLALCINIVEAEQKVSIRWLRQILSRSSSKLTRQCVLTDTSSIDAATLNVLRGSIQSRPRGDHANQVYLPFVRVQSRSMQAHLPCAEVHAQA
jgi:hypothetical protein